MQMGKIVKFLIRAIGERAGMFTSTPKKPNTSNSISLQLQMKGMK